MHDDDSPAHNGTCGTRPGCVPAGAAAHIKQVTRALESDPQWVDPDAIRQLVDPVRDGFAAAPAWARIGLVVMLAVVVLGGVFRVFLSVAGRVAGVVLVLLVVAAAGCMPVAPDSPGRTGQARADL